MRTKTGEMLMQKLKNRPASPVPLTSDPISPQPIPEKGEKSPPQKQLGIHSRLNQYHFVNIVVKREGLLPSKEDFKSLQIQNLRLIEENMKLTEWSHELLNKIRQDIMRGIQAIQEFRYLQGVNLMYSLMTELTEEQNDEFKLPARSKLIEESQMLKRLADPESKNTLALHFTNLEIESFLNRVVIDPSKEEKEKEAKSKLKEEEQQMILVKEGHEGLLRMLMTQSLGFESMLDHQVWHS